jgi:hypothetical protein
MTFVYLTINFLDLCTRGIKPLFEGSKNYGDVMWILIRVFWDVYLDCYLCFWTFRKYAWRKQNFEYKGVFFMALATKLYQRPTSFLMFNRRDTDEYYGEPGTTGFWARFRLFFPFILFFWVNFIQIMVIDTLSEWKRKRPIRNQTGYLYYQGFLVIWVPLVYGSWLSYLLVGLADGGRSQAGVVGVLVLWSVITTFVYLVARITAIRAMPYHCIAVPLFALQVASDLFTVSKRRCSLLLASHLIHLSDLSRHAYIMRYMAV